MRRHRPRLAVLRLIILGAVALLFFVLGITIIWAMTETIPSLDGFYTRKIAESTKIFDRTGKVLLYDVHGSVRRTVVPLSEVSPNAQNAAIAIEDANFYQHRGVEISAIARALLADITRRGLAQGGSTITQQVVKNTLLSNEKTFTRKIKEIILAVRLERLMPKERILELYFNETPYGGPIYGIQEASQYFFGKDAKDLTIPEAAYLAAIPQAPTYYSPFGNHRDALDARKNLVLQKMYEDGFISASDYEGAKKTAVAFVQQDNRGIKAPHFVFYVLEYLENKYGADAVNEGGMTIVTTLDYGLQQKAEEIVKQYAESNLKNFNAKNEGLIAIDPKTGEILTMVGSRDYFNTTIDGNFNVTLATRQPGSSFKPFIYATAFAKGYTPETVLFDLKTQFSTTCAPDFLETSDTCYSPDNYDGKFRGPMTLRDALAQSVNIPAVKLLYLVGIQNALDTAHKMGITTLVDPNRYGLTLVLGGGEVKLLDMTSAYGVFANDGVRHPAISILKVTDTKNTTLEEYKDDQGDQVIDPEVARTMNNILSDNVARTPEFGSDSALFFHNYDVAVKTGTTNDTRDAWIIGYTPDIVIGAWAGNNDNSPMVKQIAGFIVAPMWHDVMQYALSTFSQPTPFPTPTPRDLSLLPAPLRGAWNEVGPHEILYSINKDDPLKPAVSPRSDPQFSLWEYPVIVWAGQNPAVLLSPTAATPSSITSTKGGVFVTYPQTGSVMLVGAPLTITTGGYSPDTTKISFYLNGVFIGASTRAPFSISTIPSTKGSVKVTVIAEGPSGRMSGESVFTVR